MRQGTSCQALLYGGHQERQMRPGTENIPDIVGLATALELACDEMQSESARLTALRDCLESGIRKSISDVHLNGHPCLRLPNVLNMSFAGADGESLLMALDTLGIAVSTGSACTAGATGPSHVLTAMKTDPDLAEASLRFSLEYGNDAEESDYVLEALGKAVASLRDMSPLYTGMQVAREDE